MPRLIDADMFGNRLYHEVFEKDSEDQRWDSGCWMRYKLFERVLKEQPTVDAVEVIRCSQCKHQDKGENESGSWNCCTIGYCDVEDDYFCWWAERRQDG